MHMDNGGFHLNFPLQKVNKSKRTITGIATAENVDLEGDQILFDASVKAFDNWVGNIREMHDPKSAVGKVVDFRPTTINWMGKNIRAIEVEVYISKGAEDTWQKVLDGTLKGFSVGGRTLDAKKVFDDEIDDWVTQITDFWLGELSLVDNPANPAGMITMIKSRKDGSLELIAPDDDIMEFDYKDDRFLEKGGEVNMENDTDLHESVDNATVSSMEDLTAAQQEGVAKRLVKSLFGGTDENTTPHVTVAPEITVNVPDYLSKSVTEEAKIVSDESDETTIEKSADELVEQPVSDEASEATDKEVEDMDMEKAVEAFGSLLDDKLGTLKEEIKQELTAEIDSKVEKVATDVAEKTDEVAAKTAELTDEVTKVAESGAISKSVDVEGELSEDDTLTKSVSTETSFWGEVFVPASVANALGYDS